MILSLPSTEPARVSSAPTAVIAMGGKRLDFFKVSDPVYSEAPVFDVSHCTRCGCRAASELRSCISTDCPARDRRAA